MNKKVFEICMNENQDINDIIEAFYCINNKQLEYIFNIKVLYSKLEIILMFLGLFLSKKIEGYNLKIDDIKFCNNKKTYLQRINFYKILKIPNEEHFTRRDSENNFIEITKFNGENSNLLVTNSIKVLKKHLNINENIINCLNFCLYEIIDNVEEHSDSKIDGYFVMQYYPKKRIIKIVIIDCGLGIYNTLKYKYNKSEQEILKLAFEKSITGTNENNRGEGMYFLKNFVKSNKGTLNLYSGNYKLEINEPNVSIEKIKSFSGTLYDIIINTNIDINLDEIFDGDIPTTVSECNECINKLW